MKQEYNILIVDNRDNRNNQFISIFSSLSSQKYGKLTDKYYICNSNIHIGNETKENMIFNYINLFSANRGFQNVMYIIN